MERAVVLFSGGLDSSTCLALALDEGYQVVPLTFDYGQRHDLELVKAREFFRHYQQDSRFTSSLEEPFLFRLDLRQFGGSALTDDSVEVVDFREHSGIPNTYVPARNTIFLSLALAYAELKMADHIFIGVNAVDYSGYPDCRPEYIKAYQEMAVLATKRGALGHGPTIQTPLLELSKSEIIRTGLDLGVPYQLTWSCYRGEELACGSCDSCMLRLRGFREAGVFDPLEYKKEIH